MSDAKSADPNEPPPVHVELPDHPSPELIADVELDEDYFKVFRQHFRQFGLNSPDVIAHLLPVFLRLMRYAFTTGIVKERIRMAEHFTQLATKAYANGTPVRGNTFRDLAVELVSSATINPPEFSESRS